MGLNKVHVTAHSMGRLTGLLFALRNPGRVASFLNIEGNLAPEDCVLSRQIVTHGGEDAAFPSAFIERALERRESGSALYAASLPAKVQVSTPRPIFTSMVTLSDTEPLADLFIGLTCPRAFVHGVENRHLSCLPRLAAADVDVIGIPEAGHFPMYSNPAALWLAGHASRSAKTRHALTLIPDHPIGQAVRIFNRPYWKGMEMSVARVTEISATSTKGFEDAVRVGIKRATQTLRGVRSAWVKEQQVRVHEGEVVEYQVNMMVTFVLED